MKKILRMAAFALVFLGLFTGCKKIIKALFPGLDADAPAIQVTLPAIPFAPPAEIPVGSYTQSFNLDSVVKANSNGEFGASDVQSVKIKQMVFVISNPDQLNNLSNFESVRFTFSSSSRTDAANVGTITFPDTYADTYTYIPSDPAELRSYLDGNQLHYNVYGKLRRITTKPLQLTINVTLRIR